MQMTPDSIEQLFLDTEYWVRKGSFMLPGRVFNGSKLGLVGLMSASFGVEGMLVGKVEKARRGRKAVSLAMFGFESDYRQTDESKLGVIQDEDGFSYWDNSFDSAEALTASPTSDREIYEMFAQKMSTVLSQLK